MHVLTHVCMYVLCGYYLYNIYIYEQLYISIYICIYIYMYMCECVVYIQYICVYRYRPFTYFFPTFPSVVMLFKFDRFNASVVVRSHYITMLILETTT